MFEAGHLAELAEELRNELTKNNILNYFSEGDIEFMPTYKFDRGTDFYDTSSKKRVPAWTDRILFNCKRDHIRLIEYTSVPSVTLSDHKPVYAIFQVYTKKLGANEGLFDI